MTVVVDVPKNTYRCNKCPQVSQSYAAAERHADTHGGARIEIVLPDTGTADNDRCHPGRPAAYPAESGGDRTSGARRSGVAVPTTDGEEASDDGRSIYKVPTPEELAELRSRTEHPTKKVTPKRAKFAAGQVVPPGDWEGRPTEAERKAAKAKIDEARRQLESRP